MSATPHPPNKQPTSDGWLRLIFYGLCMGVADIIPGISGGTIAFIMGFYEDLINSIKSLNRYSLGKFFRGQFGEFFNLINWKFLIGLVAGIVIAITSLAHFVTYLLNNEYYRPLLYAFFFGLIIAATILCSLQLKSWKMIHFFVFLLTSAAAFLLSTATLSLFSTENLFDVHLENVKSNRALHNYDASTQMLQAVPASTVSTMLSKAIIKPNTLVYNYELESYGTVQSMIHAIPSKSFDVWIILCGAIAISAMILPGISGSYLLNILGMYTIAVGALADFAKNLLLGQFDMNAFTILANMLIGIILGALLFTHLLSWILYKYHDLAIAALSGFMVGTLKSVWPFWNFHYILVPLNPEKGAQLVITEPILPNLLSQNTWMAFALVLCGFSLVFILHIVSVRKQKA